MNRIGTRGRFLRTLIAAGLLVSLRSFADQPGVPAQSDASAATAPTKHAPPAKADASKADSSKPGGADKARTKPSADTPSTPERFVPSEQVRPDFDVSFPVDI